jgi:Raf kinase inhibitor-like YbhB/YbcL family protein
MARKTIAVLIFIALALTISACAQVSASPANKIDIGEPSEFDVPSFKLIQSEPSTLPATTDKIIPHSIQVLQPEDESEVPYSAITTVQDQEVCGCGENISSLSWDEPPSGTVSFVIIYDLADSESESITSWNPWFLYNIPGDLRSLPENLLPDPDFRKTGAPEMSNFRWLTYEGPCSLSVKSAKYIYTLYAIDTYLQLKPDVTKQELFTAMQDHVLGQQVLDRGCMQP